MRVCNKLDHDLEQWNKAFPDKPPKKGKCGYLLPCPWHTVIIDTAGPRVTIPPNSGLSQPQRKKIRELAVRLSDAFES